MPTNMMQIISLMKNGGNPQQMVLSMLEQQTKIIHSPQIYYSLQKEIKVAKLNRLLAI